MLAARRYTTDGNRINFKSSAPQGGAHNKKTGIDIISIPAFKIRTRQLVIFPGGGPPSIVTAMSLYDRVRDGNGCFPHAWSPRNLVLVLSHSESCIMIIS